MEKFEPETIYSEEHDIPTEIPLSPEQEAINQLIDENTKLKERLARLEGKAFPPVRIVSVSEILDN